MKPARYRQNREAEPRLRLLRLVLAFGAAGWLVSVVGAVLPWDMAVTGLRGLEGLRLGFHGLRLGLPPLPFLADTLFCLVVGFGILLTRRSVLEPVADCSPCKEERS